MPRDDEATAVHLSKTEAMLLADVDESWPQKLAESEALMRGMLSLLVRVLHTAATWQQLMRIMTHRCLAQARAHEAYLDIEVAKELGLELTKVLGKASEVCLAIADF